MKYRGTVAASGLGILPLLGLLILLFASGAYGAELQVSHLEMASYGSMEEDEFLLFSIARADISVLGGYKYGGLLRLSFNSKDLEKALTYSRTDIDYIETPFVTALEYNLLADRLNNSSTLGFELAKVSVREIFSLPLEVSYFIGNTDTFCSGDEFPLRFGTNPIASSFRGFAYFPGGINGNPAYQYDGIHQISGTGLSAALTASDSVIPILYLYQDANFIDSLGMPERGRYSADMRILINRNLVKLEAFAGGTLPYGDYGVYRGGLLAFFSTGSGADFMAQIGVPYWEGGSDFSVDNLYFMFEPRLNFGFSAIYVTLFYHPRFYQQIENVEEQGATDVNVKLLLGDINKHRTEGGIETTISLYPKHDDTFSVRVSPFVSAVTDGVRWDLKLRIDPLSYEDPMEMFESYIGVRTAF